MVFASAITSSDVLTERFDALRREQRRALVAYVTAGHPDPARSIALIQGIADAGADVIEVGVPFSDPLADGPIIQASSQRALAHGITLDGTLALISRTRVEVPIVLFSYLNPILAAGRDVLERIRQAGVSGILITDLPLGADAEREAWLGASGLAYVRLVAPTTPAARMRAIAHHGSGFVYLISRLGVTGVQQALAAELPGSVARLRAVTDLPICVGFGISTPAQAATAGLMADGVVVGSAIVRAADADVDQAVVLVRAMRQALDAA